MEPPSAPSSPRVYINFNELPSAAASARPDRAVAHSCPGVRYVSHRKAKLRANRTSVCVLWTRLLSVDGLAPKISPSAEFPDEFSSSPSPALAPNSYVQHININSVRKQCGRGAAVRDRGRNKQLKFLSNYQRFPSHHLTEIKL